MWHTQSSKDRSSIPKICKVKMQIVPLLKSYTFDFLMFSILKILNLMLLHELAILLLYVVMKFKPMTSLSCLIFICRNHFRTARFRESATPAILERGRGEPCPRPLARSKLWLIATYSLLERQKVSGCERWSETGNERKNERKREI